MPVDRLVIANMRTGLESNRTPFIIDNDAFPQLINAYVWRGRIPRKRGTFLLGRLEREISSFAAGNYTTANGTNTFLIFTRLGVNVSQPNAAIVPKTLVLAFGAAINQTLTDSAGTGTLAISGAGTHITAASINYATGVITITADAVIGPSTSTLTVSYFPDLPVMGLQDFDIGLANQPLLVAFDTRYSYEFDQGLNQFYDTTFYKITGLPFVWNGADYQQFYTTNYLGVNTIEASASKSGCMWATNGNPGFHFLRGTYTAGTGTPAWNITFTDPAGAPFQTLKVGDILWFNEWAGSYSATPATTDVNSSNGTVTAIVNAALGQYTVTFTTNKTIAVTLTGIAQMMTNFLPNQDGIRWYDGDPVASMAVQGWVNFAPPLNQYIPAGQPNPNPNPYYLAGANLITPFKGRLIFSSVYLQTTAVSAPVLYYANRIVYSQAGTPYYSLPLPLPLVNGTPDPMAWFQNVAAKGGFLTAPFDELIITVYENNDVLIYGQESHQLRLVFTFDDALPFIFQTIDSELGSQCTFSAVKLNEGVLTIGNYGILITNQIRCQRIDLQIPDNVFQIAIANNGSKRATAVRDFRNEWVYFTYCPGSRPNNEFNSQTLLYNYRDNTWAIFNENYTHYGTFRRTTNVTWSNVGQFYPTWSQWQVPWDTWANQAFFPQIVAGNQDGFVMARIDSVGEEPSQFITAVNISTNQITSPNHCLNDGDFIQVSNLIGITISSGETIFKIHYVDANNFILIGNAAFTLSGTYVGGGVYKRFSRPQIQTKQFPLGWKDGRGLRVGMQRYLLENSGGSNGQITAQVFSSQNADTASNDPGINPYLVFEDIVLTTPEPDLYGANPSYTAGQQQLWHRQSNSFNGDTVQMGFTLSDEQMFDGTINTQEIIIHAIVLDLYPGATLA